MAENYQREIAALEQIRNSGARSVTVDGVSTTFQDDSQIRTRIAELQARQGDTRMVKPRFISANIGECM